MLEKNENLQILADTAFESENYELAYDYYNRLLEMNIENHNNWLRKGYCASHLSKFDRMLDKEVLSSVETVLKFSIYKEDELTNIANQFSTIIFDKIVEGAKFIQNKIEQEFNALHLTAGTLHFHNFKRNSIEIKVWSCYSEKLFQYFKVMDFVVRMKPTAITCEKGYRSVYYTNTVSKYTGEHFYKLDGNYYENILLRELLQFSKYQLDMILPNNDVTNPKSASGCFIATAAMGNYNHPIVLELRYFRDSWLLKRLWGQKFTEWYYRNSPKAANKIKDSVMLRSITFALIVVPLYCFSKAVRAYGSYIRRYL
ncbi:CFI-box-CTERM domain-containing protein [Flavobacterium marginilacus]|uniref:CFI-box-CTERM domain-containing protein n=1 Tax=Flavobacterium marginilacus TaxID=3003256 RepID=UPI00248DCC45|nr:CFI-box-CTERM domain-containing protein [Flavobacterium marginilacus]